MQKTTTIKGIVPYQTKEKMYQMSMTGITGSVHMSASLTHLDQYQLSGKVVNVEIQQTARGKMVTSLELVN